jgi:geranylgeranyl reductase family protein
MEKFDVVIIGAGPAGLQCAERLGGSRLSVLVLEKNEVVGPKVCAGGLVGQAVKFLKLPDELIECRFDKFKFCVNNKCSTIVLKKNSLFTVNRRNLGQWQLNRAEKFSNIEVRTNSNVDKIVKDHILVGNQKIGFRFLVGADGPFSIVKKFLGVKTSIKTLAIQYIIPTSEYKEIEICYVPKLFSTGYAWIFPHNNYVSVGCGLNHKLKSAKKLKSNFKLWLNHRKIDVSNAKFEGFPIDCGYQGYRFNNIFLIGDAGGFTSSLTGEGIYPALVSGSEAAKEILDSNYQSDKINLLLTTKLKHNKILKSLIRSGIFKTFILQMLRISGEYRSKIKNS